MKKFAFLCLCLFIFSVSVAQEKNDFSLTHSSSIPIPLAELPYIDAQMHKTDKDDVILLHLLKKIPPGIVRGVGYSVIHKKEVTTYSVDTDPYSIPINFALGNNDSIAIIYYKTNIENYFVAYGEIGKTLTIEPVIESNDNLINSHFSDITIDSGNIPHVCYFNRGGLYYATKESGEHWVNQILTTSRWGVFQTCSIKTDKNNIPHISFLYYEGEDLYYATKKDGNWKVETVDNSGRVGFSNHIAIDSNGLPSIVYVSYSSLSAHYSKKNQNGQWSRELIPVNTIDATNADAITYYSLDSENNPQLTVISDLSQSSIIALTKQGNKWLQIPINVEPYFPVTSILKQDSNTSLNVYVLKRSLTSKERNNADSYLDTFQYDLKFFEASFVSQTQPKNTDSTDQNFYVKPGDEVTVEAKFKNTGTTTWLNSGDNEVTMAIYKDIKVQSGPEGSCFSNPDTACKGLGKFGESYFYNSSWHTSSRISSLVEKEVKPGDIGTFKLTFKIPADAPYGTYREDITAAYGTEWMDNFTNGDEINKAHVWVGIKVENPEEKFTIAGYLDLRAVQKPRINRKEIQYDLLPVNLNYQGYYLFILKNQKEEINCKNDLLRITGDLKTISSEKNCEGEGKCWEELTLIDNATYQCVNV